MAIKTDFIDMVSFGKDVLVDKNNLSESFANQGGMFAHYSVAVYQASLQASSKKLLMDTIYATLDKEVREAAVASGEKITEDKVKQSIRMNPKFIIAQKDHIEAEALYDHYRNLLEAFRQRKDMLVQMGADAREEMKGELRMSAADQYRRANGIAN